MSSPPIHVVLHQPEIAENTGNVGRTCAAVGAKLWLVRPLGFRLDERRLRRAGLDYWQYLDWEAVEDWAALEARLAGRRLWLFTKRASREYTEADFRPGDGLVFGGESAGLPEGIIENHAGRLLRIPMTSRVRSLNLSVSVAVAAYEALRQCRLLPEAPPQSPHPLRSEPQARDRQ